MPNNERFIQQSTALQIDHQTRDRFVYFERVLPVIVHDTVVRVHVSTFELT